jgi:hypothetical protein
MPIFLFWRSAAFQKRMARISSKKIQEGAAGHLEKGSMTPEKLENAISGILKKRLLVPNNGTVS